MPNSIIWQRYRSPWQSWFHFLIVLFFLGIMGYGALFAGERRYNRQAQDLQSTINQQNQAIAAQWDENAYQKLKAAQEIITQTQDLQWSEHIPTLINMLQELQSTDHLWSDAIILSDFKVWLEEISLRGTVTNLILLYRDSPKHGYISLINKFESLSFISSLTIQEYQQEDGNIEFVLTAQVTNDQ